jgi:hypothetical protein
VEVGALQAQGAGRGRDIPAGFLERPQDLLALGRLPRLAQARAKARGAGQPDLKRH